MPGPWTDAHCHLADERFAVGLREVVARSREVGVVSWVQGGICPQEWQRQRDVRAELGDGVRLVFGVHPWWASAATDEELEAALGALETEVGDASAIGEVGLDLHPRRLGNPGALSRQRRALAAQLALAKREQRPMVLHVVRAHDIVLGELERLGPFERGGIVHAFSGTEAHAHRYVELGFLLSLGGALADRPDRLQRLSGMPVEAIVVETDAPDQAPRSWQVTRNEPAFLPRIAQALAPAWGLCAEELLDLGAAALDARFVSIAQR